MSLSDGLSRRSASLPLACHITSSAGETEQTLTWPNAWIASIKTKSQRGTGGRAPAGVATWPRPSRTGRRELGLPDDFHAMHDIKSDNNYSIQSNITMDCGRLCTRRISENDKKQYKEKRNVECCKVDGYFSQYQTRIHSSIRTRLPKELVYVFSMRHICVGKSRCSLTPRGQKGL
eukprot:scaffold31408_cov35-Prasinocladus_malaysianus.AAC.3